MGNAHNPQTTSAKTTRRRSMGTKPSKQHAFLALPNSLGAQFSYALMSPQRGYLYSFRRNPAIFSDRVSLSCIVGFSLHYRRILFVRANWPDLGEYLRYDRVRKFRNLNPPFTPRSVILRCSGLGDVLIARFHNMR